MDLRQRGEARLEAWIAFCVSSLFFIFGAALLIRYWLTGYAHFRLRGMHFYGTDAVFMYLVFAVGGAVGLFLSRRALIKSAR